jgi:enamine deaminase RidA (YjgF/YER057c/UK114 family)
LTLIETPDAPHCNGHYSQAVVTGGLVFLSNQLPLVPGSPGSRPFGR